MLLAVLMYYRIYQWVLDEATIDKTLFNVLPMRKHTLDTLIELIVWVQQKNHRAYLSHRKKRLKQIIKDH